MIARKHRDAATATDDVEFWTAAEDIEADLDAGKTKPDEALRWVAAAYKAGRDEFDVGALERAAVRERDLTPILRRVRGKRTVHVRAKSKRAAVQNVIVHRSTRPGYTLQITEFDKDMEPWGHRDRKGTMGDALREVWKDEGPFELVVAESVDEAMPATARTTFDSAPYANMRLLDVARLLQGAAQQSRPNISLITKLVDRLIHALEFTIYSIQGRPEGKRVGTMIRKAFNALTARIPELAMGERRDALRQTARLNEAVETLDIGPVEARVR